MDGEGGDPTGAWLDDLEKRLLGEVVGADEALIRDEEDGFCGVEVGALWGPAAAGTLGEGVLGFVGCEGVDCDVSGGRGAGGGADGDEMVAG